MPDQTAVTPDTPCIQGKLDRHELVGEGGITCPIVQIHSLSFFDIRRPPEMPGNDNGESDREDFFRGYNDMKEPYKGNGAGEMPADPKQFTARFWAERDDLEEPDNLLGSLLSTTCRAMIIGDTGIGKTSVGLAMAVAIAAAMAFLHWCARRSAKVLYLDGEMSALLARARVRQEKARWGSLPDTLIIVNRHDYPNMLPLNTEEGQQFIEWLVESLGGVDLIVFDNMQALLVGSLKDDETWKPMLPWIRKLTEQRIGQLWLHHTGHDTSRAYGDKSREWQFDTVGIMAKVADSKHLIDFELSFSKARERTPDNRADFEPVKIWLDENNVWKSSAAALAKRGKPPSPQGRKFYDALVNALGIFGKFRSEAAGRPSVTTAQWKHECHQRRLIDPEEEDNRQRALISKYRLELIAAELVVCNGDFIWSTDRKIQTDFKPSANTENDL